MIFKQVKLFVLALVVVIISCKSDDPDPEVFLCCGDNPFASLNVDNLIKIQGEILIPDVFTPNSDGLNDSFIIAGLAPYPNHIVTIFDLNDIVVYKSIGHTSFFNGKNQNSDEDLEFGSYKYKIVIENEQTFVQYGYVCLIRNKSEANGFDFSNCAAPQTTIGGDPVLVN